MKVSLKLEDQQQNHHPILFKAKIPIAVFGLPFLSAFSATHHHRASAAAAASDNLSLSLRTHFPTGPSLKLSYNTPTATATATTAAAAAPLTLTLKSGVSFSGSPNNSPLIISANFSFSPQNPNPNPSFTIQFKPRLGSFSLRKSVSSAPVSNSGKAINGGTADGRDNSYGFVPLDRPINWKELTTVDSATKDSILSGVSMAADTDFPVTRRVKVNLRWGVNLPPDFEKQLPYLRVNKIKIERIDEVNEEKSNEKQRIESDSGEFEALKGMYSWMSGELSDLRKENREMRRTLEEITSPRQPLKSYHGYNSSGGNGGGKRALPLAESLEGAEQWRMKKSGDVNGHRETKKNVSSSMDVESELQRAIKAASSS